MKIVVYTSIAGNRTKLVEAPAHKDNTRFVAITDDVPRAQELGWEAMELPKFTTYPFYEPRRNAKVAKMLPSLFFDWDYTIYADANVRLNINPQVWIDKYLAGTDIAMYKHPERNCAYDEIGACGLGNKDLPGSLEETGNWLHNNMWKKNMGLWCGYLIIRRNTLAVQAFGLTWWELICKLSSRDQLTMPFALAKHKLVPATIPGQICNTPDIDYRPS